MLLQLLACAASTLAAAAVDGACGAGAGCGRPTHGNMLLQSSSAVAKTRFSVQDLLLEDASACDEASWPDKDHGLVCGECKVLVNRFSSFYKTCDGYCHSVGRQCVGAWEELGDTCIALYGMRCDQSLASSDAICQCGARVSEPLPTPTAPPTVTPTAAPTLAPPTVTPTAAPTLAPAPSPAGRPGLLTVMSYNTEYRGYPSKVGQFGDKIREVGASIVGTQECQDKYGLARASGYRLVPGTGSQNPILYNPDRASLVHGSSGWMSIPRDKHAPRAITWAKFRLADGGAEVWHFNTHLPHNHGEASSRSTHARIAQMLLEKRRELGAESAPTVITGDMNPFASVGAVEGSLESTLRAAGFAKVYQGRGNPGYGGLDKIFASEHWAASNGADRGTGGSDHPAIAVDLMLRA